MGYEELITDTPVEMDTLEREERCRKILKVIQRAIFMRVVVTAVLLWAVLHTAMELWVIGLMMLILAINLTGLLPLFTERKKQRKILNDIIAEEQ